MNPKIYVAGLGIITAIGKNISECLLSFKNGHAGMGNISLLHTVHQHKIPAAEVKLTNNELAKLCGLYSTMPRTALLSAVAAAQALQDANIKNIHSWRTGFISANTVGGMEKTELFCNSFLNNAAKGKLRNVVYHECGSITETVAELLGIKDHISTISTACSSSANAILYGARLIKNNVLDIAVAGGADALTKFTLNGFSSLMILDTEFCKPFDENRNGLNLGEGAGYVVLVSDRVMNTLQLNSYCTLSGYCNANDAYHQTASSPDGTGSFLAMTGAMKAANVSPDEIDYINLHGTGTQNNDFAEGTAIMRIFKESYPKMSSTKSFTGHTLGACGGIEAVFSVMAIKQGIIYPNLRFTTQMKELDFKPATQFIEGEHINHVLSNSFGFGGNCTSLLFSKI